MDSLIELTTLITKSNITKINLLNPTKWQHPDKVHKLYSIILSKNISTDFEASILLGYGSPKTKSYLKVKNNLKERLINSLFFINKNNPKFTGAQKAFYSCNKNLMAIKILIGRNARNSAISLTKKTLTLAQKYELTDKIIELLIILKTHNAIYTGNKREYHRIKDQLNYYQKLEQAESFANTCYEEVNINYVNSIDSKRNEILEADKYLKQIDVYLKSYNSFKLYLTYFFLKILRETIARDYKKISEICIEAIKFFETKPLSSKHFVAIFYYHQLLSLINLKQYSKGEEIANKCFSIYETGSLRWFRTTELFFLLCMHTKYYYRAYDLGIKVLNNQNLKYQFSIRLETWKINEAYLYYIYLIDKISLTEDSHLKSFRLTKFLNEVPIFSTDKRGYNIPILIIQILILIHKKRYKKLSDKMEAIEKYTSRYLRKNDHYRSNCFIRMLMQLPKRNFHRSAVNRHAKPYLDKLQSVPLEIANQPYEIEIIPYEHLWEFALDSLDNKFH